MKKEILDVIKERGLLLEKEVFELIDVFGNPVVAKEFLERLERASGEKMITRNVLSKNFEFVKPVINNLDGEEKESFEKVVVKLGVSLEVSKEVLGDVGEPVKQDYKIYYSDTLPDKKLEVKDFTGHFRSRFQQIQRILMARGELQQNLVSIGKIGSDRNSVSIIGIVTEKRVTKNKNLIMRFEDLTGSVNVLAKFDREEIFSLAEELQLDDIVGVKASGNRDMLFVHEIFFPDSFKHIKTRFLEDCNVAFISDIHAGSDRHLGDNFEKFLEWLNGESEDAKKIRYIFIVGDNVDGVGVFPGQENVLELKSMEEQYELLASYLNRVPKRISMFMCPGQHDACRVAEPQPLISKKYAAVLYGIENLVLVTNPCTVKLIEKEKEFNILMYHGASIHTFINEIKELRLMKAHKCPAKAVVAMLKRRHLSPTHGGMTGIYIPNCDFDPLVISEVPDVLCTGEVHRLDIENYNGVTIITGSCWQSQTPFEEKVGNEPDPCKVPILNLKTREIKILDFSD